MKKSYSALVAGLVVFAFFCIGGCKEEQKQEQLNTVSAAAVVDEEKQVLPANPVADEKDGQDLFQQYCAVCHPGGGNIINPNKGLDGKSLAANGISTAGDIVATMRQPGPGMSRFEKDLLSDREAGLIAEYILETY